MMKSFSKYLEIEKDECRIFYEVFGSNYHDRSKVDCNQPTMIFLHGGPGVVDHSLYMPFWSKFSGMKIDDDNLQIIFIDHRGCGRSYYGSELSKNYGDEKKWNLKQWGEDIHTFYTKLGLTKKPIIAGVSFGGVVAMSYATQYPQELGGLILSDTDAKFDLNLVLDKFAFIVKQKDGNSNNVTEVCETAKKMFLNTTTESYEKYIQKCLPYCASKHPYRKEEIARCVKNEKSAFVYNKNELNKFNFLPELKNIECQTLVLTGDQNPVHTLESAKKTAMALDSELVTFKLYKGAGSPVYRDKEKEVINDINLYLQKLQLSNKDVLKNGCV